MFYFFITISIVFSCFCKFFLCAILPFIQESWIFL